jgi:hypothetical protein
VNERTVVAEFVILNTPRAIRIPSIKRIAHGAKPKAELFIKHLREQ